MKFGRFRHADNESGEGIAPSGPHHSRACLLSATAWTPAAATGPPAPESPLKQAVARSTGYTARSRQGEVLQGLGRTLADQGHGAQATDALRRAVLAFRAAGDKPRMARALTDWGVALARTGRFDVALVAHEAALDAVRELGDWRTEGIVLANLGVALSGAKRHSEAAGAFDVAATLATIAGAPVPGGHGPGRQGAGAGATRPGR